MELDINNFSSFFELITGFYILLGISDDLHGSLNIQTWIKNFVSETQKEKVNKIIKQNIADNLIHHEESKSELKKSIDNFNFSLKGIFNFIKLFYKFIINNSRKKKQPKYIRNYLNYERLDVMLFKYDDENKGENTYLSKSSLTINLKNYSSAFLNIINPIYLYFGILNLYILLFSGFIDKWDKNFAFQYFNIISLLLIFVFIIRLIALMQFKKIILKLFSKRRNIMFIHLILFILTILYIIICPLNHPVITINFLGNIENTNVFLCVFLPLFPLIIHIFYLNRMIYLQNQFKKNYLKRYVQKEQNDIDIKEF